MSLKVNIKKRLGNFNLDVAFETERGVFAILGASGCGKSMTLKCIAGIETPDEGRIELNGRVLYDSAKKINLTPQKRRVGYMFQDYALFPNMTVEQNIKAGMGKHPEEEKVRSYINRFRLEGLEKHYPAQLSGGQKQRVAMARMIASEPDILLLDEPTNYLDVQHIEWLKRYLLDYENAFILISHDIPFLNSVINLVYHMENQRLDRYVGDYDKFQEVYAVKKAQLEAAYKRQQQEIADLEDFVARNKARVATRNMAMSRQKKLDKMEVIELAKEKPKPEFHFLEARTAGKYIFETKDLVIGYDEPLSRPLNLVMERGQKAVLVGANGIGKTTLLKSILGLTPALSGSVELGDYLSIGYFEQEMAPGNTNTCLDEIWKEFPSYTQYQVRSALAKCGLTTKHIESQVRVLSGGEQAKVRLCKLINRESNVLLLDEPTNHLDVDAKAELKRALKEYKGSILLICHEPEFYEGLATDIWDCRDWALRLS